MKIVIAAFVVIQIWFIHILFSYPSMGIHVMNKEEKEWKITHFESRNIAAEIGIQIGDRVLKVDGQAPSDYSTIRKWRMIEQADTILISRGGQDQLLSTSAVKHYSLYDIASLVGEILSFVLAFILYRKMKRSKSAVYLAFFFSIIGAIFMSLVASLRGDELGKFMIGTLLVLLPVMFMSFLVNFLQEKSKIRLYTKSIKYMYSFVVMWMLASSTYFIPFPYIYEINYYGTLLIVTFFIVGLLLNFFLLLRLFLKYRKEKSFASTIIKTIWASIFISFAPVVCFSLLPLVLFQTMWADPLYMGAFILIFPLTFAYLIISRKLYDIDLILRRLVFTILISLLPSAGMVLLTKMLAPNDLTAGKMVVEFILFVLILSLILYSLEYFTTMLESTIFPRKHQLQVALRKIAKNLGTISSFRQLKEIFLMDIVNSLQVVGGAIVFKYKDTTEFISEGRIDQREVEQIIDSGQLEHNEYTLFEINRHEEFTSYLIMTRKKTNTMLGLEETQWLQLIITYLSVCLENIHLVRKLTKKLQHLAAQIPNEQASNDFMWFRKLTFELQERERVRIATDLHDTTMQDLFFLKDRLHTLLEKYAFRDEDQLQMKSMVDYIDVINSNLRQSCFELHPYLLKEIGLIPTMEKLVRFEKAISDFNIEFYSVQAPIIEKTDLETKRHLFRIAQELINNAKKHSHAKTVRLYLKANHAHIVFDYEDDGIGYEKREGAVSGEIGSPGIGVEQMKSRVLSLSGHFELETSPGNGYKFRATFPLKEGLTA
jgi:two-component system sensor histidine kinase ComP